jgi:hypothetical protein
MLPVRHSYPLMVDVGRRRCRARGLIECSYGSIVVVGPQIRAEMPRTVQRIERPYQSRDLR